MKAVKIIEALSPTIAIIGVVSLETVALNNGIDGAILAGALAIIGGLGGYQVKKIRDRLTNGK